MDGIYSITFRGAVDWGIGMLVLRKGVVTGADTGGVYYDGHYRISNFAVEFNMTMTVPPGATLVQGTAARPNAYTISFKARISKTDIDESRTVTLDLPQGPVNAIFCKLRELGD